MRRLLAIFGVLLWVTPAHAFLPNSIETVIKSWFNSVGQLVKLTFVPSTPTTSDANRCVVYMNRTTGDLESSCAGRPATVVASASSLGCTVDSGGNMACNSFTSTDQNNLGTPAANRQRLYDNDVNLTPDPSCSAYGLSGVLTLFDVSEGAADLYAVCDGSTTADYVNATVNVLRPFGWTIGSGSAPQEPADDDDCYCFQFTVTTALAALEKTTVRVGASDADDTVKMAIYSEDGLTELYEGAINVTSIGYKTVANELTAPALPRGDYWFCVGYNEVTANAWSLEPAWDGEFLYNATAALNEACPAGDMPSTISPTPVWGATIIHPIIALSDE